MTKDLAVVERADLLHRMSVLWLEGERNPTALSKRLGLKRAEVLELIDEYKAIIRDDVEVKERAKEALVEADNALSLVIQRMYETVEQADDAGDLKTKATLLKNIADVDIKRVETLQKAGLYDDAALGDELAEMEEKQQILISILKEVSLHCDNCKFEVARRLRKVTGTAEEIPENRVIEGQVVSG